MPVGLSVSEMTMQKKTATATENFKHGTLWTADNLEIMRGLNSGTIDLIYLDPPFNSNRDYEAPVGSQAAKAAFKDTWTLDDVDNAWHGEIAAKDPSIYNAISASEWVYGKGMKSYLIMMAVRLMEMKRLLKSTATIYLHCDPTASHYLKMLMDAVFGKNNFRNEILWCYTGPSGSRKNFPSKHDTIFRYSKSEKWVFNADDIRVPYSGLSIQHNDPEKTTGIGGKLTKDKVQAYEDKGKIPESWWSDISPVGRIKKERVGYPTQKPLALLDRIIKASSHQDDLVLDPFCGCATTLIAAEKLQRRWLGIDLSAKAADLVKLRMQRESNIFDRFNLIHRTDLPRRTDLRGKPANYRTNRHELFGRQEGACNGCKHSFPFRNFTVDHIIPKDHGGSDHMDNLQLLCGACNSTKGIGTHQQLLAKLKKLGIIE